MPMSAENRKKAADKMRARVAARKQVQYEPQEEKIDGVEQSSWVAIYFEDGRAFKIPVNTVYEMIKKKWPHIPAMPVIASWLSYFLEWDEIKQKAIPLHRNNLPDDVAWETARKEWL